MIGSSSSSSCQRAELCTLSIHAAQKSLTKAAVTLNFSDSSSRSHSWGTSFAHHPKTNEMTFRIYQEVRGGGWQRFSCSSNSFPQQKTTNNVFYWSKWPGKKNSCSVSVFVLCLRRRKHVSWPHQFEETPEPRFQSVVVFLKSHSNEKCSFGGFNLFLLPFAADGGHIYIKEIKLHFLCFCLSVSIFKW